MTKYINPITRSGGVEQIIVPVRQSTVQVDDAPFDDNQYVRMNGEWVPVDFPKIIPDTMAPAPPTNLSFTSSPTASGTEVDYDLLWADPTTNVDGTPLTDFGYYVVRWHYTSGPWAMFISNSRSAFLPGLVLNAPIEWQVMARDISGNDSTWGVVI